MGCSTPTSNKGNIKRTCNLHNIAMRNMKSCSAQCAYIVCVQSTVSTQLRLHDCRVIMYIRTVHACQCVYRACQCVYRVLAYCWHIIGVCPVRTARTRTHVLPCMDTHMFYFGLQSVIDCVPLFLIIKKIGENKNRAKQSVTDCISRFMPRASCMQPLATRVWRLRSKPKRASANGYRLPAKASVSTWLV